MGLFGKKKEAKEQKPIEEVMAQNVFGKTLLPGEKIDYCIQGKGQAEKLVFSTAVLAVTEKRCLYFEQDGSQSKTETLMYDKIVAISQNTGFEKKMGNYIGGDSFEILPFKLFASVEPTILYSNSSSNSQSRIFTLHPMLTLSKIGRAHV